LIDSRTGISEISGITMSLMADEIVLLAAKNDENILGLKQIIKSLSLPENTFSGKLPKLNFVLCRIPYFDRPEEKSIEQGAINEVARDLKEFVKEFNLTFEFEKLFIIHSDPTLEIEEKLLMGYQYEKEEGNKQFIQRKFRLKSPIATDYLDLFEELTKGKLSAKEKLIFNNIKKSEFLIERVQSISDNNKKIELLLEAIDLNQRSDEAHSLLAKTYFSTGDHEKALEIINKAIELNLESSDYLCTKAIILGKLGKEEDAEDLFNQVLKRDNKNFLALSNLGTIFYTKKEYEKALDCYSSVVRLYPDYAIGYNEVGNIFRAQKKYEEAFKYIYKALELKPRDSMSTGTLAEIYAQLGNDNEFYKNFELCLMFTKNRKNILSYIESEDVYKPYLKVPRFLNLLKKYNIDMDICK
jgi:tetratricopeptide (TPR) repeat protein